MSLNLSPAKILGFAPRDGAAHPPECKALSMSVRRSPRLGNIHDNDFMMLG
ncbi:MAG: hypothetical protein HC773_31750 [Scytonema sp. CRU_2_7]|nr:hypothetical protein [Scytonema sp. CRU_2_7]